MGEAKRRKKLDPNFGQNYPASEENWVFTSASDDVSIGNLNDCLQMAGLTTKKQYKSTYVEPLFKDNLSEKKKSSLLDGLYLSQVKIDDELYHSFFKKAVRKGEIYIDINIRNTDIEEDWSGVEDEEESGIVEHHIVYSPKQAENFRNCRF